jgi:hypothetical protein
VGLVVLFLVHDVGDGPIALLAADGDDAVAPLPSKRCGLAVGMLVEMVAAAAFDLFDEVGDGKGGWNRNDQVKMIVDTADRLHHAAKGVRFAANVGIEDGFPVGGDEGRSVFCGPNKMVMGAPIDVHGRNLCWFVSRMPVGMGLASMGWSFPDSTHIPQPV